eukprot:m.34403 g.34403  ORF g.34403 m.34403 type:complete len:1102 (-) comp14303_c0_seq1:413-3718(-)
MPADDMVFQQKKVEAPSLMSHHPISRSGTTVLKTGFALKEGHLFRTWRRRWCVLRVRVPTDPQTYSKATHFLLYYKVAAGAGIHDGAEISQSTQNPGFSLCGVVPLIQGVSQVKPTLRSGHDCLCVVTPGEYATTMYLEPENDKEGWYFVLDNLHVHSSNDAAVEVSAALLDTHHPLGDMVTMSTAMDGPGKQSVVGNRPNGREKWAIVASSIGKIHLQSAIDAPVPVCPSAFGASGICYGICVAEIKHLLFLARTQKRNGQRKRAQRERATQSQKYTTEDFVRDVIKPLTNKAKESYVNLLKRSNKHIHGEREQKVSVETCESVSQAAEVDTNPPTTSHIGPASVFVCHAWHASVVGLLESLIADHNHAVAADKPVFYWIDFCCRNQHDIVAESAEDEYQPCARTAVDVATTPVMSGIERMVVVLSPLRKPAVRTRAWCLFELGAAYHAGVPTSAVVPPHEARDAWHALVAAPAAVLDGMVAGVDSTAAVTTVPEDRSLVRNAIEAMPGQFATVNHVYTSVVRECMIAAARALCDAHASEEEATAHATHLAVPTPRRTSSATDTSTFSDGGVVASEAVENTDVGGVARAVSGPPTPHAPQKDMVTRTVSEPVTHATLSTPAALRAISDDNGLPSIKARGRLAHQVGCWLLHAHDHVAAIPYLERARRLLSKALPAHHRLLADVYSQLGSAYDDNGEYAKAIELFQLDIAITKATLGAHHPSVGDSYNNLGVSYRNLGDYDQSIKYFEKDKGIREDSLGSHHPSMMETYNNLGLTHADQGNHSKAADCFKKALQIHEANDGRDDVTVAATYNYLGTAHRQLGNVDECIAAFENELQVKEAALGLRHLDMGSTLTNLGQALLQKGRFPEAIKMHKRARTIYEQAIESPGIDGAGSMDAYTCLAQTFSSLGTAHARMGDVDTAIAYFTKEKEVVAAHFGTDHEHLGLTYNSLGAAYCGKKNFERAIECYQESLRIRIATLGAEDPQTGVTYNNIGRAFADMGDSAVSAPILPLHLVRRTGTFLLFQSVCHWIACGQWRWVVGGSETRRNSDHSLRHFPRINFVARPSGYFVYSMEHQVCSGCALLRMSYKTCRKWFKLHRFVG